MTYKVSVIPMIVLFICFLSSGGKGVGCCILLVGVLLLLSESQAERLYAVTPAGSIGRCGDDGNDCGKVPINDMVCGEHMFCCS